MSVLDWFTRGTVVPDIYASSGDAEFIIDSDFAEDRTCDLKTVVWRECQVPVSVFGLQPTQAKHPAVIRGNPQQTRSNGCLSCVSGRRGDIQAALRENHLLLTI